MFKRFISFMLAADCIMGAVAYGCETAEKRTVEKMQTVITESVETVSEQFESGMQRKPTTNRYVKDSLGVFSFTFYVPDEKWGYSTSTGAKSTHMQTCAVDPKIIPYGSTIMVTGDNGQTLYLKCVDCGSFSGNKIDIFYDAPNHGGVKGGYAWIAEFGTIHNVYLLEE